MVRGFVEVFEQSDSLGILAVPFGFCCALSLIVGILYLSPLGPKLMADTAGKRRNDRYDQDRVRVFLGRFMLVTAVMMLGLCVSILLRSGVAFLVCLSVLFLAGVVFVVCLLGSKKLRKP